MGHGLYCTAASVQLARRGQTHPHATVPGEAVVTSFSHFTPKHILTLLVNLEYRQAETPAQDNCGTPQLVLLQSLEYSFYETPVSLGDKLKPALQMRSRRTGRSSDSCRNIQVGFGGGAV